MRDWGGNGNGGTILSDNTRKYLAERRNPCHKFEMPDFAPERLPWPREFPEIVIHTNVATRDAHPLYTQAKSGNAAAALSLANDLLDRKSPMKALKSIIGNRQVHLLPVVADEVAGFNAIPDAMAQWLSLILDIPVINGDIVQINKVGHTRAKSFQRFVTPARFDGPVQQGARYLLVDDHVGLGGTLANLKGYVEARGAEVVGITTLTESRDARKISLQSSTLAMLWAKHGEVLNIFWRTRFGYSIDCLTEVEDQILCREHSVNAIEDRLAKGAIEARSRGVQPTIS